MRSVWFTEKFHNSQGYTAKLYLKKKHKPNQLKHHNQSKNSSTLAVFHYWRSEQHKKLGSENCAGLYFLHIAAVQLCTWQRGLRGCTPTRLCQEHQETVLSI